MLRKPIMVLAAAALLSSCAITPRPLSLDAIKDTAISDIKQLDGSNNEITGPIGLEEAIARAVKYNRDKKLKAMEAAMSQGQFELIRYEMLPQLTASAGYTERNNYAASASVTFEEGQPSPLGPDPNYSVSQAKEQTTYSAVFNWNILDFGLSYVRARQHADRYLIARERERKIIHNITQDVRAAYWKAVSAERLMKQIVPLIDEADEALNDSRKVEQMRLRSPLDALVYQRELLDMQRVLQSLRQDLANAKTELTALMGMKPGTPFELADVQNPQFMVPELNTTIEHMEELALTKRPELVESHYQKRISAAETRAALMKMLPGISLNAGAYYDDNDYLLNQDWTSIGAQVSWNLVDIFKFGAEQRLATTREGLAEAQRLATSMAVLTQVHLANIRYIQARNTYSLAERYLEVSNRISEQTDNLARMERTSELERIRESLNNLLAQLRRDVAYSQLQNSYGRIFVTMGMDLLPEGYTEKDLAFITEMISKRLESWQHGKQEESQMKPEFNDSSRPGADLATSNEIVAQEPG